MAATKYGEYVIREPLHQSTSGIPTFHICTEEGCVAARFPGFPNEITMIGIAAPTTMNPQPHAHEYDQLLLFWGGNPLNFFEFDAEVEVFLGKEGEKHVIDTTAVVYVPRGLVHCPINYRRVGKPILFMQICDAPQYKRSVGDMSGHPAHGTRTRYPEEQVLKLRRGIT